MTKPMTPERLSEIKARCEAATEGPWDNNTMYCAVVGRTMVNYGLDERLDVFVVMAKYKGDVALVSNIPPESEQKANGQFIAHARQDLPDCIAEIERLEKLNKTLTPICMYCFRKWPTIPNDDVDAYTAMVPEILEHVSVCEKNPLVQEIERLRGILREVATKHYLLKNLSTYGPCKCKGSALCMKHAAIDILKMLND
ncbi:hypothetical protein LCGC14_1968190 [marine sediment metagenome]|uniref:Uncharacterized protein n=1 Tax=marine sediment metagenome TaxID=412755 RepID=A0A0F9FCW7_9ZZZZ